MELKKQSNPTARWDHTANAWWIGETTEYQWVNQKQKPVSNWMDLDSALRWIIDYDINKTKLP